MVVVGPPLELLCWFWAVGWQPAGLRLKASPLVGEVMGFKSKAFWAGFGRLDVKKGGR